MRRGDIATVAVSGDFGKPRPALVVQADSFETTSTVTVLLMTSHLVDAPLLRYSVQPTTANGLRVESQIMIDKVTSVKRERVGDVIGRLDDESLTTVNRLLALLLGFA